MYCLGCKNESRDSIVQYLGCGVSISASIWCQEQEGVYLQDGISCREQTVYLTVYLPVSHVEDKGYICQYFVSRAGGLSVFHVQSRGTICKHCTSRRDKILVIVSCRGQGLYVSIFHVVGKGNICQYNLGYG